MNFLVIGYGSIGRRHTKNLIYLGHEVILLRHASKKLNERGLQEYYSLEDAVNTEKKIDGAIICSPTSNHHQDALKLLSYQIPFLLEKPPADNLENTISLQKELMQSDFNCYDIAFNLRYYAPICFIKNYLKEIGNIYSARISAGSYLPNWRENIDYRETSSASKNLGGGVHYELIHEIDYIIWFWGLPDKVMGYVNKISNLEISTMDICAAILVYNKGFIVELHLDYLSHKNLRGCQIIGQHGTLEWSVNDNQVFEYNNNSNQPKSIFSFPKKYDFNETYIDELNHFIGIIRDEKKTNVTIDDSVQSMLVLNAIVESSEKEKVIHLGNYRK